jgi:predicted aspartyl protease
LKTFSLTIRASGISKVLITPINLVVPETDNSHSITALWDTGATGSAITKRAAQALGLVPTGIKQVQTANGLCIQNTYTVNIVLLNGVRVTDLVVTELDGLVGADSDALIGMDVICLGDFSITNHKGKTCMSFRVPSIHEIDYVAHQDVCFAPEKKKGFQIKEEDMKFPPGLGTRKNDL